MNDISLKQLEIFVAVVEYGGFTRAAEELFFNQSTVSAHISLLEQALGKELFVRSNRRHVRLTKEGEQVYPIARRILNDCAALRTLFSDADSAPVVALGGIAMCAALLPVPGVTDGLPKMGDLLVIFYLFPIPAMAIMLAGSSSGSPYGGIGFSREMIMMLAYEVPLLMIMLTVAMKVGGGSGAEVSLTKIMDYQAEHGSFGLTPVMWPAFLAWLMFLPATLGVPPFDQPEAETEILEGPLLEYSGVLLAFFHMASALKMVVALALGVVLFFPGTISDIPAVNLVWFVVKCALFMLFALTVVKSATGRLRIEQALSFFLKYPAGLALLSLILVWIGC